MTEERADSWLDRPVVQGLGISREQALYIVIIVLCLVSRLAMLGYRVQSHDESLHTQHSWYLYVGQGYQHNPMMHGPFLYHVTALSYFLFGDSDFTARLPVALLGTALVALPYLLRRYLGRGGALAAAVLLLISPSVTYYSRYIRMDIPSMLWALIVVWAIFRYLDEAREHHLYILAGALSLMYATKEVAPIYTIIIAVFLVGLFVVRALLRPWHRPGAEVVFVAVLVVAALALLVLAAGWLLPQSHVDQTELDGDPSTEASPLDAPQPIESLPTWAAAGGFVAALAFVVAGGVLLYGQWGHLRSFRSLDLIVLIGTLSLPFASPIPITLAARLGSFVVSRYPELEIAASFWSNLASLRATDYAAPSIYYSGAIVALVVAVAIAIGLVWDRRRWSIAAAIHTAILLTLFTTVFTNGAGIATGWVGSVGYWLEQQEVERGGQPWFYYLVVLPLYDFLPLVGALAVPFFLAVRAVVVRVFRRAQEEQRELPGMRSLFLPFALVWSILAWLGYSYAGERMPWLVLHITLPMVLLAGWLLGQLVEAVDWRRVWEKKGLLLVLILPGLAAAGAAVAAGVQQGPLRGVRLDQLQATGTFFAGLLGLALLGRLAALLWARIGLRQGLLLVVLSCFFALGLLTVRVAYRFSFVNFDRPAEFLVYAHEGPDVRTTMEQLEQLSLRVGGGSRLIDVSYGPDGTWPFIWYLRNYPNARYYPAEPTRDQVLATAIIAGRDDWDVVEPLVGDDYVSFEYFFLWWPMEDYRQITVESLRNWLTDPQRRAALWQIFYSMDYRLYDEVTGGRHVPEEWVLRQSFRLYVRRDVAGRLWDFGVGTGAEPWVPASDPYADGWQSMSARLVWGSEGSGLGYFSRPRGVAVASDGSVYVADSGNHRIQRFTAEGVFVTSWGGDGGCPDAAPPPGTFCEPWGVAVGPDGSVYVADTWAHRIQRFTPDGEFLAEWGTFGQYGVGDSSGQGFFYGPRAVAVGPEGAIYVADTGNKRIQVFSPEGEFLGQWGGAGSLPGQLQEPVGLAFGPDGRVVVADTWNRRLQILEPDGTAVDWWPVGGWNNEDVDEKPYVAVGASGRIYVTDPGHYRVLVFGGEGTYLYSFGQFGFDSSSFGLPVGVAVGPSGSLYVTDAGNHRVMLFDLPE